MRWMARRVSALFSLNVAALLFSTDMLVMVTGLASLTAGLMVERHALNLVNAYVGTSVEVDAVMKGAVQECVRHLAKRG